MREKKRREAVFAARPAVHSDFILRYDRPDERRGYEERRGGGGGGRGRSRSRSGGRRWEHLHMHHYHYHIHISDQPIASGLLGIEAGAGAGEGGREARVEGGGRGVGAVGGKRGARVEVGGRGAGVVERGTGAGAVAGRRRRAPAASPRGGVSPIFFF